MSRSLISRSLPFESTTSTTAISEKCDPFELIGASQFNNGRWNQDLIYGRDLQGMSHKLVDVLSPTVSKPPAPLAPDPKDSVAIILDWDDTLFPTSWMRRVQTALYKKYKSNNASYSLSLDPSTATTADSSASISDIDLWTMFDLRHLSSSDRILLRRLELSSIELLKSCLQRSSRLYIITNAQLPWVQLSAKTFMPKLLSAIHKHDIPIISARDSYLSCGKDEAGKNSMFIYFVVEASPEVWKVTAFQSLTASFLEQVTLSSHEHSGALSGVPENKRGSSVRNRSTPSRRWWRRSWRGHSRTRSSAPQIVEMERCIVVSIGDSECERSALLKCRETYFQYAYFKSIKLVESPHPLLLKRQQDYVRRCLNEVLTIPESLDIIFVPPPQTVS